MGLTAYEMAHDLIISPVYLKSGTHSYPHSVPWEEQEGEAWWRDYQEGEEDYA